MTNPTTKCNECGYEGEVGIEVCDGLCQDCSDNIEKQEKQK